MNFWRNKRVAITGGAALIGSHLAEYLVSQNVGSLLVLDDLSSGRIENLKDVAGDIDFLVTDLRENYTYTKRLLMNADIVFHLACAHGGRLYVDTHYLESYQNLELDATVFRAAHGNVGKIVYMSSACAYPIELQQNVDEDINLTEDLVSWYDLKQADGAYGMAKLLGEAQLYEYFKTGQDMAIVRGFTVYGPRMKENHAVLALIAKSLLQLDPFPIFGTGKQKRNWTYVKDTVRGLAIVAEKANGIAVNIGTEEANTPDSLCKIIWEYIDWKPNKIEYDDMLSGPQNRVADASLAKSLGWEPEYTLRTGVRETINWYLENNPATIEQLGERMFSR